MKRKYTAPVILFLLLAMLSSCSSAGQVNDSIPEASPLSAMGGIDWGDCPKSMVSTSGLGRTTYFDDGIYTAVYDNFPYEYTYNNEVTQQGIELYTTRINFTGLQNTQLQKMLNQVSDEATEVFLNDNSFFDENLKEEYFEMDNTYFSRSIDPTVTFCGNIVNFNIYCYESIFCYDEGGDDYVDMNRISAMISCYDMESGKKLALEDLFVNGTDVSALLNPLIAKNLGSDENNVLIRPFRGLPANYPYFSLYDDFLSIYLPEENPYTTGNFYVNIPINEVEAYLARPTADIKACVPQSCVLRPAFRGDKAFVATADKAEEMYAFGKAEMAFMPHYVRSTAGNDTTADMINRDLKNVYSHLALMEYPDEWQEYDDMGLSCYKSVYNDIIIYRPFLWLHIECSISDDEGLYPTKFVAVHRCYNTKTGQPIPLSELIRDEEGLKEYLKWQNVEIDDLSTFYNFYLAYSPDAIYLLPSDEHGVHTGEYDSVSIPEEYINTEYFK